MNRNALGSILAGALAVLAASQAQALQIAFEPLPAGQTVGSPSIFTSVPVVTFSAADVGSTYGALWHLTPAQQAQAGGTPLPGTISAEADFTLRSLTADTAVFDVAIRNTTSTALQASIMSIGLGISPDAQGSYLASGGFFDGIVAGSDPQQTFPGGFKGIDVCLYAANGCSGGKIKDGLAAGGHDTLTLKLRGDFDANDDGTPENLVLSLFTIKFQTSVGSFEFPDDPLLPSVPTELPEPGGLALLGIGALALRAVRRRAAVR